MPTLQLLKTAPYNYAPCGYLFSNSDNTITALNATGLKWLGYAAKELVGKKKMTDLLEEKSKPLFQKRKKELPVELVLRKKSGKPVPVILYDTGQFFLLINIAKQKKTKEQFQLINESLFKLENEKEYFLGIASHDLQHPLAVITHLCELMVSKDLEALSPEQYKIILLIQESADEMRKLFQNFLLSSRFENGNAIMHPAPTNISQLTANIVARYREIARKKEIMLYIDTAKNFYIETDPDYFSRIMENLISNAIKYTMPQKNVWVTIEEEENTTVIKVNDEGVGIRKKEIPYLFEKFQTLSSKPTGGELSTGLGLNITRFLLDQLNGTITVKSKWGQGSCFEIKFPALATPST